MQPEVYLVRQAMTNPFTHGAHQRRTSNSVVLSWTRGSYRGIGECAPRQYVTGEDCESVLTDLSNLDFEHLNQVLATSDPIDRGRTLYEQGLPIDSLRGIGNNTRCLVEMAVLDTLAQQANMPLSAYLLRIVKDTSNKRSTLPAQINITQVLDLSQPVETFIEERKPQRSLKIKVAADPNSSYLRLQATRAMTPQFELYVDPNMSWSADQLRFGAHDFHKMEITLFEEPLPAGSLEDYRQARLKHGLSIMLDESVTSISNLEEAWRNRALDAVNLRISKCGGLLATSKMIEQCYRWGLPVYLGVQVAEVGPLIAAHRALLTIYDNFLGVEAGQHDRFFDSNLIEPMPAIDRKHNIIHLPIPTRAGLGCELTPKINPFHISNGDCASTVATVNMEQAL